MAALSRTQRMRWIPRARVMIALLLLLASGSAYPNVYYYFDESPDGASAFDSGGEGVDLPYLGKSTQTTEAAKFGSGSLALGQDAAMGFGSGLAKGPFGALGADISRMTITLWMMVKADDNGGAGVFMAQRLNALGRGGFTFCYSGGRRFVFYTDGLEGSDGNAKVTSEPTAVWPAGEWVHVAMTFDKGTVAFYFNGELAGVPQSLPDGVTSISSTDLTAAIFYGIPSSPSIQYVDDFGFFGEEALSSEEILNIYKNGLKAFAASRSLGEAPARNNSLSKK